MAHPKEILRLVNERLHEGEALVSGFRAVAQVNDHFVAGSQYGGITYKDNHTVITHDQWFDDEDVPRVHVNVLGNLVATLVSLMTKNRPCARATPTNTEDAEDVYSSERTNTFIRYLSQELKTVEVTQQALKLAVTHGSGGIKVWWDKESGKAALCPVSLFNVTMDPQAEDAHESSWFVFHRWLKQKDAERLCTAAGVGKKPAMKAYTTASGVEKRGVPAREFWLRPGMEEDYPAGLYAFIVDDVVVEQMDYPLVTETDGRRESIPPLVWIVSRNVEECVYGRTPVTDCIPIQRTLNETFSRTLKYLRLNSSPKMLHPDALPEGVDPYTDAKIPFPTNEVGVRAAEAMRWLQGPPIPREAFDLREFCIKQIHDIIGVAPLTAGTETRNVSGKALEEIEGLDAQKNSQTTRSLEVAVLDLYRALLFIVQKFYDDSQKLRITGGDAAEMMLFNRADIMGADQRLEPASEFDLMQDRQEQSAMERANAGTGSAEQVRAAAGDPRHAYSRALAEKLVQQALAGQDVELASDDVDVDAMKAVIAKHKHIAMLEGRKTDFVTLTQFEAFIEELAAAQPEQTSGPDVDQPNAAQPPQPEPMPPPGGLPQ